MSYTALKNRAIAPKIDEYLNPSDSYKQEVAEAPLQILLVEDEASDVLLAEYSLDLANIEYELHTLRNGSEVMPYLKRQGAFRDEQKPDLLMLDLSLPKQDGFEVLASLAANAGRYRSLPIVILTGDSQCSFLRNTFALNIVAYITKPCTVEKINHLIKKLR